MARTQPPASLQEIRNPTSVAAQIAALRSLKNEIIGHDEKKELVVRHGVVLPLVRNLSASLKGSGKRADREANGHGSGVSDERDPMTNTPWTDEDELRLQTTYITASLARAGLPIVVPLISGGILPPLLAALSPESTPPKLIVESLRAINTIAEAIKTDVGIKESHAIVSLADMLYAKPTIDYLKDILSQRSTATDVAQQSDLTLKILEMTLFLPHHQTAVVKACILDVLGSRLATYFAHAHSGLDSSLPPQLPGWSLAGLLNAVAAIVQNSLYNSVSLLYNQDFYTTTAAEKTDRLEQDLYVLGDASSAATAASGTLDVLLPKLQAVQTRSEHSFSKVFPPLASLAHATDLSRLANLDAHGSSPRTIGTDDFGSPIIAWLVVLARGTQPLERLAAIWLLAHLIHATDNCPFHSWSDTSRNRDRSLAILIAPLVMKMIDEAHPKLAGRSASGIEPGAARQIRELAPQALALLLEDRSGLQKVAVDAKAPKLLCQVLKKSFDQPAASKAPLWSPHSAATTYADPFIDAASSTLGPPTLSADLVHIFRCRSATLMALAAVGQKDDAHRKLMIENGVVQCIVESLTPWHESPAAADSLDGNPPFVIVSACKAATALSRSVSILRTSLIDGGIAKPIFAILKHSDAQVRLAATNVITNLVLHFSPMREELMASGVTKVLCDHAHTADAELRISSLWALKHLVDGAPNELKMSCLEELGTGWLIQTLTGELSGPHRSHMATSNAAGEQVDILNSEEEPGMDLDEAGESSSDDDSVSGHLRPAFEFSSLTGMAAKDRNLRLRAIKAAESNTALKGYRDDIRTQEQALDFVRNLVGEPGPGQPDMVEHVFSQLGTTRFFEIIVGKLKPKPFPQTARLGHGGLAPGSPRSYTADMQANSAQPIRWQPPELLISTLFILIHVANGRPSHRQLLINQPSLLDTLRPVFQHPDRRIRVACCWLVHNLLWQDDGTDKEGCRQRAMELRIKGVEECVRRLINDEDLDTRERAKGVVDYFTRLLDMRGDAAGAPGTGTSVTGGRSWDR